MIELCLAPNVFLLYPLLFLNVILIFIDTHRMFWLRKKKQQQRYRTSELVLSLNSCIYSKWKRQMKVKKVESIQ